jgi:outer membrane protein OmpA-like peptidoglycan-associated protein
VALARAVAIKQKLVDAGVPESHIEAVAGTKNRIRFILHR